MNWWDWFTPGNGLGGTECTPIRSLNTLTHIVVVQDTADSWFLLMVPTEYWFLLMVPATSVRILLLVVLATSSMTLLLSSDSAASTK